MSCEYIERKSNKIMSEIKMFFKGGSCIKDPVDANNTPIKEGDTLTTDFLDNPKYGLEVTIKHKTEPFYIVKKHKKGYFYAESIKPFNSVLGDKFFYLHDFRFKYCLKL